MDGTDGINTDAVRTFWLKSPGGCVVSEQKDPALIDPGMLDREIVTQPQMTRAAGYREADARHAHDQAKAALAVLEARLSLVVRRNPAKFDLPDKPTVDAVAATVLIQPEYVKAQDAVIQAKYALDVASADTVWTLDRRKMLERLVDLIALDYHAEKEPRPRTDRGRSAADGARTRDVRASLDDSEMPH